MALDPRCSQAKLRQDAGTIAVSVHLVGFITVGKGLVTREIGWCRSSRECVIDRTRGDKLVKFLLALTSWLSGVDGRGVSFTGRVDDDFVSRACPGR